MALPHRKETIPVTIHHSCASGCGCHRCCTGCNNCNTCNNCGCNACATVRTGCNCFGTLRSIAGPFNSCGTCVNRSFPFYTGPCGPCNNNCGCNTCGCNNCGCNTCNSCGSARTGCACNNCNSCSTLRGTGCGCDSCDNCGCDCCDECCDACHASASFAGATPVELACGDAVALSPTFINSGDFNATHEGIEILRSGTYLIVYTVHIPARQAVSSRFVLTLNGERIAASALDVATEGDCTTDGFTMHAMVNAQAGSVLKLVSLNPVSICQFSASNVFTLSLTRIP